MYAFIEGKVCDKGPGTMVIEAGGVGYLLNCSMTTIQSAPPEGEKMRCQTWLSVKEDALELYGFATTEEKKLFLKLISVSGVGPKMALGLLGAMSVQDLNMAILMEDLNSLSRAPGIGKKMAQRICMELRDKVSQSEIVKGKPGAPAAGKAAPDAAAEAMEALMALGYSSSEVREALSRVHTQSDQAEELIRLALRAMAGA